MLDAEANGPGRTRGRPNPNQRTRCSRRKPRAHVSSARPSPPGRATRLATTPKLAATCAMESNCQNVGSSGGSSATGAFQMISSTYNADIKGAVAYDPSIAGTIVSGSAGEMDPGTEAYAAAYELRQDALSLQQNDGISDPTVLQTRAVYQFGGNVGLDVANAPDSANIAQLTQLSAASLAANGLNSSSTVGQWRQTIINKLGSATASQSILQQ